MQNLFTQTIQLKFSMDAQQAMEVLDWIDGREPDIDVELFDKMQQHYALNGEMPYAVAKAVTEDPFIWVKSKVKSDLS